MSIIFEEAIRENSVKDVANKMMLAARTAPRARGRDNIVIALAEKDEIENNNLSLARTICWSGTAPYLPSYLIKLGDLSH